MSKSTIFRLVIVSLLLVTIGFAQDNINISKMEFCTEINNYKLKNVGTKFTSDVGSVYCFTKVEGAQDTTTISHIWYYDGEQQTRVDLPIKSKSWRTWSSKKILKDWTGTWRVDIVDAQGELLKSKKFMITSEETSDSMQETETDTTE